MMKYFTLLLVFLSEKTGWDCSSWLDRLAFSAKTRVAFYSNFASCLKSTKAEKKALKALYEIYSDDGERPHALEARIVQEMIVYLDSGKPMFEPIEHFISATEMIQLQAALRNPNDMVDAIKQLAEMLQKRSAVVSMAIGSAMKPMVAGSSAIMAMLIYVVFLVPVFEESLGTDNLPTSMLILKNTVGLAFDFWYIALAIIGGSIYGIMKLMPNMTGPARLWLDKIPPFNIYSIFTGVVFLLALSTLTRGRMQVTQALDILRDAASPWLRERISPICDNNRRVAIGEAMAMTGFVFPSRPVIARLRAQGEIEDMATAIREQADIYFEEARGRIMSVSIFVSAMSYGALVAIMILMGLSVLEAAIVFQNKVNINV
jgi:type II secretory pathway component PulF